MWPALVLVFVVVLIAALLRGRRPGSSTRASWPYYPKKPLSQPEQVLYHRLVQALPEHIVLAQVQVSRVLGVKRGYSFHEWNNRINRLSYDFVVCAKDSSVIAAIELDDSSHETPSRMATDQKKDLATASAGVKLIRWHVKALPDSETIRAALADEQPNYAFERTGDVASPARVRQSQPLPPSARLRRRVPAAQRER